MKSHMIYNKASNAVFIEKFLSESHRDNQFLYLFY